MTITIARSHPVYSVKEVESAKEKAHSMKSPELEAFYEDMLTFGGERFVTTPSNTAALDPLYEHCPNFDGVLDDLSRYLGLALAGGGPVST